VFKGLIGPHTGNLRHLRREGQNLYLIYYSVMSILEVCDLITDHKTLWDRAC